MANPKNKILLPLSISIRVAKPALVKLWLAKPAILPYQKILNWESSAQPQKTYIDNQNNEILYFNFQNPKKTRLAVSALLELKRNYVDKRRLSYKEKKIWIKPEKFLEQPTWLKKITKQIISANQKPLDKARRIFEFVYQNFTYQYPVNKRGVSNLKPHNLKGDCAEYAGLFVAMCRTAGIPAKNLTGFIIDTDKKRLLEHGWAAFYIDRYGWLQVDPQYASLERTDREAKKYFTILPDWRFIITQGFNIPLNPPIPKKISLKYWNKRGLPLTRKSVQTLQPLVFVDYKRTKTNYKLIIK